MHLSDEIERLVPRRFGESARLSFTVPVILSVSAAAGEELRKLLRCDAVERDKNGIGLVRVFAEFFVT